MKISDYIEINPQVRFGRPVIIGTRISVHDVLGWLADGMSITDIISDFPELNGKMIQACLLFASNQENLYRIAS